MRNLVLLFFYMLASFSVSYAQKTKKPDLEIGGSLDFGLIEGYPMVGAGAHAKLLWPVKQTKDAFAANLSFDRLHEDIDFDTYSYSFILTSFGYRKSLKSFFIEPKMGVGVLHEPDFVNLCGFLGIEPGFEKKRLRFSLDCRLISAEGLIYGPFFHTFAFKVGYKISANK